MRRQDVLHLRRHGEPVRTFPLTEKLVEVGTHPTCDIVVHSECVSSRAILVQPSGGSVYWFDLVTGPGLGNRRVLALGTAVPIGDGYSVVRVKEATPSPVPSTDQLDIQTLRRRSFSLVLGNGSEAKTLRITKRPVSVGVAADNTLCLSDVTVSRHHLRLEPTGTGVVVRDLGSTNGTWVDGMRVDRVEARTSGVLRAGRTEMRLVATASDDGSATSIVATSGPMMAVVAQVERFATLPWPVLVHGETGVGKERIARALHDRGPRSQGAFVALNAGGLPRELVESELFGHEKGAFTGAVRAHRGAFEQADGGTLFLDEIAELPAALQTRLLRVLETWTVRRVGSETSQRVNVRLVCATHRDLRALVANGTFRADLYYRIHRLVVEVPPLRHRPRDVSALAAHFVCAMRSAVGEKELTEDATARLLTYAWPGNARELRNVLELAAAESSGELITAAHVERALQQTAPLAFGQPSSESLQLAVEQYGGNASAAARALGIPRSTLRDRLKQAG